MLRRAFLSSLPALTFGASVWAIAEIDLPAPPLRGKFFDGTPFDLAAMTGKVVLVNFYSSYCKYCAYEIGNVEAFYEQRRGEGLEIIVLGVDAPEDRPRVERMLGIYNLPGAMVHDLEANGFGRRHPTPTAYVVDRAGILRNKLVGAKTPRRFHEQVVPLLS